MTIENELAKIRLKLQIWQMDNNLRKFQHSALALVFGQRPNIFLSSAECENAASVIQSKITVREFRGNARFGYW